eukprot:CAMPEP_0181220522 /NCGR_PEP_ID=MMETSP1096-20121128/28886_1 /TAXON_ID=156174 ORGANISM="Chrysochromulina ericina, Strain CCMP281" /NCGR_SAMPLE_ID=MMETSP1096 /ASSEMBLY_ACC=CAM_ASM_000453 /LENGTH=86 /DNA_ID=CAMNT_0023313039 /DNA_START=249 /DNA_END=506 /DNA_ORIENTATION=-
MGRVETRVGVVEIERLRAAARFRVAQQVGARQRAAHTAGRRIVAVSGARAANEPATPFGHAALAAWGCLPHWGCPTKRTPSRGYAT